jgi:hypothetical protein
MNTLVNGRVSGNLGSIFSNITTVAAPAVPGMIMDAQPGMPLPTIDLNLNLFKPIPGIPTTPNIMDKIVIAQPVKQVEPIAPKPTSPTIIVDPAKPVLRTTGTFECMLGFDKGATTLIVLNRIDSLDNGIKAGDVIRIKVNQTGLIKDAEKFNGVWPVLKTVGLKEYKGDNFSPVIGVPTPETIFNGGPQPLFISGSWEIVSRATNQTSEPIVLDPNGKKYYIASPVERQPEVIKDNSIPVLTQILNEPVTAPTAVNASADVVRTITTTVNTPSNNVTAQSSSVPEETKKAAVETDPGKSPSFKWMWWLVPVAIGVGVIAWPKREKKDTLKNYLKEKATLDGVKNTKTKPKYQPKKSTKKSKLVKKVTI